MQRPTEDFMRAAVERSIRFVPIHRCGGCDYQCGFVIEGEAVGYDSGCDCSSYGPSPITLRSWEELADSYNRNQPERNDHITPEWVAEQDAFWGFDQPSLSARNAE